MKVTAKPRNNAFLNNEVFAIRLRQLRKEKGMTQTDLASKLHVTRSGVANWENGTRFPDCGSIKKMGILFGVPVDYLYGMTDHRYNINIPDYLELDIAKLNDAGIDMLCEYYRLLLGSDKYKKR